MARYRLTRKADADIESLYRFGIERFGLSQADIFFDSLVSQLQIIADSPKHFQRSEYRQGYRRCSHPPYTIYFREIDGDTVEVVRVLGGQDPRSSF